MYTFALNTYYTELKALSSGNQLSLLIYTSRSIKVRLARSEKCLMFNSEFRTAAY